MSLTRVVEAPEVEVEVSKLINRMLQLCQGYRQIEMRCLTDELNLMSFGRLFELIRQLEGRYTEEIIRFQVNRGQRITWYDVKPVEQHIENGKPIEMFQSILNLEKNIHQMTLRVCKLAWEKNDLSLSAFLEDRVILRQTKVIRKRANQLRNLKRSEDDMAPFLTSSLSARREIEKLEKLLRLEVTRREWRRHDDEELEEIKLIGSTSRF